MLTFEVLDKPRPKKNKLRLTFVPIYTPNKEYDFDDHTFFKYLQINTIGNPNKISCNPQKKSKTRKKDHETTKAVVKHFDEFFIDKNL